MAAEQSVSFLFNIFEGEVPEPRLHCLLAIYS